MWIKLLYPIVAMLIIGGLVGYALSQGINGVALGGGISAVAGLAGFITGRQKKTP